MIEPNLGNLERIFRLIFGVAFAGWAFTRPEMHGIEWFVILISLALILNGVFSRCYVWYVWNINTRRKQQAQRSTTAC